MSIPSPHVSPSLRPTRNLRKRSLLPTSSSQATPFENNYLGTAHDKRPEGCRIRLLSVAIQDYKQSPSCVPLTAPVHDQDCVIAFARSLGATSDNVRAMKEDSADPTMLPTHNNILVHMGWLVESATPNDFLIFHYSGHGHQVPTKSKSEQDGYDEALVTMDKPGPKSRPSTNLIRDNVLRNRLVVPLQNGTILVAIMDACRSGTMLDLDSTRKRRVRRKGPNDRSLSMIYPPLWFFDSTILQGSTSKRTRSGDGYFPRRGSSHNNDTNTEVEERKPIITETGAVKRTSPERDEPNESPVVICFSACRDDQSAWAKDKGTFNHHVVELLQMHRDSSITPAQYETELNKRTHCALLEDPRLQTPALTKRMRGMQVAQVTTLAGQDHLLRKPLCLPRLDTGPTTNKRRLSRPS